MESISVWNNNMLRYEIEKSAYIAVTNNRVVWGREPRDSNQSDLIPYFFFTCCQCKITTTLVDKPEGGGEKRGEEHQDHPVVIINRNSKSSMWVIKAEFPSTTLQYHKLLGSYTIRCSNIRRWGPKKNYLSRTPEKYKYNQFFKCSMIVVHYARKIKNIICLISSFT